MKKIVCKEKMLIFITLIIAMLLGLTGNSTAENKENKEELNSLEIRTEYEYNEKNNTVICKMISNNQLKETKPTWSLDETKKIYIKQFEKNQEYQTRVEDIYGNVIDLTIKIELIDEKGPEIEVDYTYDESKNVVIATIKSNEEMANNKPTWKLSENKLEFKKEFKQNEKYKTKVTDKWKNQTEVEIKIDMIDDKRTKNRNGISI